MPNPSGTLETLALQLGKLLQPLEGLLGPDFFARLGVELPREISGDANLLNQLSAASNLAGALDAKITSLSTAIASGNAVSIISAGAPLITNIAQLVSALSAVGDAIHQAANGLDPAEKNNLQAFAETLAARTLEYMIVGYLDEQMPTLTNTLAAIGVIDKEFNTSPSLEISHAPLEIIPRRFYLDKISQLITHPDQYLQQTFNWGANDFDGSTLLLKVQALLESLGVPAVIYQAAGQPPALEAYVFSVQADASSSPPGLKFDLSLPGSKTFDQTVSFSTLWQGSIHVQANYAAGIEATLRPPFNLSAKPPTGNIALNLLLGLKAAKTEADPIIILGVAGGTRLQATGIGGSVGVNANLGTSGGDLAPAIQFQIDGGKLIIDMSEADGFLSDVTSGTPIEATFTLAATWAPDTGIHVTGGAQLEINLPVHLDLGPVTIQTIYIVGGLITDGLTLELSAAIGVTLGPIQASVDRVGLLATLTFPQQGGNLGPANLSLGFKPPNGLGIAIDAGVVAGGGYIMFDPDKGQYAGVLDVSLAEIIQVKVIAVLDTKLPDGSRGFSFLLIITFDFPPIQLGFGFTLNGVGGLGGVNRSMNTDALHDGFRAHTLNSILFPPDPIANAPQIISNIENFFPPADGRYLFGPMLEMGWGTPTLITLSVGVILEVPDPIRLALLGLIDAGLPTTDAALIELHIDVLGVIDFGAKTLAIDGELYDSRVLIYSLAGSLCLRLSWGNDPNFVFSLGGFNPHFNTAGLNLPVLHRLSVSIGDGDNPRISANSYFAITSNSLQFGSNVEAYASAGGFAIHGYLGFDVLIIFSPFSFEFDFSAGFDVSYDGASLLGLTVDGTFSGPRPWHLHGDASIHILFFSVSASVDLTWGDSTPAILPQKPVLPDLLTALQDPRNWSSALPDGTTQAATLSTPKPDDQTLRVHPIGTLSVRENIVPLDLQITRYGNATPSDGNYFSISDVQIDGQEETKQNFQDYFAAGQFLTLSDADKVSRPSFEKYDAGATIGSAAIISGANSPRTVYYEERYIDEPTGFSRFTRLYAMPADIHSALTRQGAGFASPLKNSGLFKYTSGPSIAAVTTQDPAYVVAQMDDLSVRPDITASAGKTFFQARAALDSYLTLHPEESANLQILPMHEVAP
jgi:hypothetical protein